MADSNNIADLRNRAAGLEFDPATPCKRRHGRPAAAETPITFVDRLNTLLAHLGISQAGLGRKIGVSSSLINRIVKGTRAHAGTSASIVLGCFERIGLHPSYWTSTGSPDAFMTMTPKTSPPRESAEQCIALAERLIREDKPKSLILAVLAARHREDVATAIGEAVIAHMEGS